MPHPALPAAFVCLVSLFLSGGAAADVQFLAPDRIFGDELENDDALYFSGVVAYQDPLGNAAIFVEASDGSSYAGQTDEQGRFSFKASGFADEAWLSLRARGSGQQSFIEWASSLGDYRFLKQTALPFRNLNPAHLAALRVNPFQTALHVTMRDLPPTTLSPDGRTASLRSGGIQSSDLIDVRGPLLALMSSGELALPTGASSTLAAVSDRGMLNAAYASARQLPKPPPQVTHPTELPLGVTIQSYDPFALGYIVWDLRLRMEPDGSGVYGGASGFATVPIQWNATADPSLVRLTRLDGRPFSVSLGRAPDGPNGTWVDTRDLVTTVHVRFVVGPRQEILVASTTDQERYYPNNPELPPVLSPATQPFWFRPTLVDEVARQPFGDPSNSAWVLPACAAADCGLMEVEPGVIRIIGSDVSREVHRFNADGTGTTARMGVDFQWQLKEGGGIELTYAHGAKSLLLIASHDLGHGRMAVLHTTPDGVRFAFNHDFKARLPQNQGFVPSDIVGIPHLNLFGCDYPMLDLPALNCVPNYGIRFDARADGTGQVGSLAATWEIDTEGRVIWRLYSFGTLFRIRSWQKLAEDSGRVYVLENISANYPPPGAEPEFSPTTRMLALKKL